MSDLLFNDWPSIFRIGVIGIMAYPSLILLLRISGKRTLAQMNAFDFIITVAFGSALATVLLSKDVSFAEGIAAFAMLILLQYAVAYISVRIPAFGKLVKAQPRLIFHEGSILSESLRTERIRHDELLQAVRNQGIKSLDQVHAVILETNGSFSIIKKSEKEPSALANIMR